MKISFQVEKQVDYILVANEVVDDCKGLVYKLETENLIKKINWK